MPQRKSSPPSPTGRTELCSSHGSLPAPGSILLNPAALSLLRSPMIIPSPCFPSTTSVPLISPARPGNDGQRSHRDSAAYLILSRMTYLNQQNSRFDAGKKQLFPLVCRECSLCCRAAIPNGSQILLMDTAAHKCIGQEGSIHTQTNSSAFGMRAKPASAQPQRHLRGLTKPLLWQPSPLL